MIGVVEKKLLLDIKEAILSIDGHLDHKEYFLNIFLIRLRGEQWKENWKLLEKLQEI